MSPSDFQALFCFLSLTEIDQRQSLYIAFFYPGQCLGSVNINTTTP